MHIHVSLILIYMEFVIKRADFKHIGALFSLLWIAAVYDHWLS